MSDQKFEQTYAFPWPVQYQSPSEARKALAAKGGPNWRSSSEFPTLCLPPGMLSVHAVSCAAYAVGETPDCHRSCDVYYAETEGWKQRRIMREEEPDPGGVQWVCPACLKRYSETSQ